MYYIFHMVCVFPEEHAFTVFCANISFLDPFPPILSFSKICVRSKMEPRETVAKTPNNYTSVQKKKWSLVEVAMRGNPRCSSQRNLY